MKKPNITIIGSGNVAFHLGLALRMSGYRIVQVYGRRRERAQWLAGKVSAAPASRLEDISQEADIYLIAVSDDAIHELASTLRLPGKVVAHTSGSTPAEALSAITDKYGVFYPLQSFKVDKTVEWTHLPVLLSGSIDVLATLQPVAQSLTRHVDVISDEQRAALHLAAVFINNFTNHCFTVAHSIADTYQVDFRHLIPLAAHTVRQALELDTRTLQTGPARRGDDITMDKHLQLLANDPLLQDLYKAMSKHIMAYYAGK